MKTKFCIAGLVFALNFQSWGALYSYGTLAGGAALGAIPDNNTVGLTESHTLSGLAISLSTLTLTVVLQGGYAPDLSGYLRLGNLVTSPYYDLTTVVQSQTLSEGSATTITWDLGSAFSSDNPNNTWTLFFADTSAGAVSTLNGYSLNITAVVPEPVNVALGIFAGLLLALAGMKWVGPRLFSARVPEPSR